MTDSRQITLYVHPAAMLGVSDQAEYYARRANEALAQRWESAVDQVIYSLLKFPSQGSPCKFPTLETTGLRSISIPNFPKHLLFYRYLPLDNTLVIVHVAHGARDLESTIASILSE
jgi:plasmid stabilization system protein ParE